MEGASKCDLCSKDFISRSELNHHAAREHAEPSCKPKQSFVCRMCDNVLGSKQALLYHMRRHTGERPFKCTVDDCGMAFTHESTLNNHVKCKHSDERPFKCHFPGCWYAGKLSTDVNKHKKVHSDDRRFACSECDYKTNWNRDLERHRMRRHSARRDFKCSHPQCTKSFQSSAELKSHFSHRHEERNLKCDHPGCGRKYSNANVLNSHKRAVHSTKSLLCPNVNCDYRTNTKGQLASHMKVHDARKEKLSFSMEGCQYKVKNSPALESHMNLPKTLLPCPESGCGGFAPTKKVLEDHVRLHNSTGMGSDLFQCPLCFMYYPSLAELQVHCAAHTNEKPFGCGHCEYAAAFRSSVKQHVSSAHPNVKFPFIVHLLDDRECLDCNVTLPPAEFLLHCEGHVDPVVMEAPLHYAWT